MEPSRPKSPQDGSKLLKKFVHRADQRRVACRNAWKGREFWPRPPEYQHNISHRPDTQKPSNDGRSETRLGTTVGTSNQLEPNASGVCGLYARCNLIESTTLALLPAATSGLGVTKKPAFTLTRRKLQTESITGTSRTMMGWSPVTTAITTSQHIDRTSSVSKLATKLDTILRSSPWMRRRKVIIETKSENLDQRGQYNAASPQITPACPVSKLQLHTSCNGKETLPSKTNTVLYKHRLRVLHDSREAKRRAVVVIRRFVRLWRSRKQHSDDPASSIMSENGSIQQSTSVRYTKSNDKARGDKFEREIDTQATTVASIFRRRMVGEVPAHKFTEKGELLAIGHSQHKSAQIAISRARAGFKIDDKRDNLSLDSYRGLQCQTHRLTKPRSICYPFDTNGGRRFRKQLDAPQTHRSGNHIITIRRKSGNLTIERATNKSLQRRMIFRVKVKRRAIEQLTYDFTRMKKGLAVKLGYQLALRQAENERMSAKRYSLLFSNDANLPPHLTLKELHLAQLRYKKSNLLAQCQSLELLGAALHCIESAGEVSGLKISAGEQQFLELLRSAVQGDHVLTQLLVDGIRGQFTTEQRQKPLIAGLLRLLERVTLRPQ